MNTPDTDPEILVIGCGPAGAAAAAAAAAHGLSVLAVDARVFPRDKTCGDGLTPRAMTQLAAMGLGDRIGDGYRSKGLKLHGFGGHVTAAWPDHRVFAPTGSAMRRSRLDSLLAFHAAGLDGVTMAWGWKAQHPVVTAGRITAIELVPQATGGHGGRQLPGRRIGRAVGPAPGAAPVTVRPKYVIVADGVRSTVGKALGRVWHREQVFGTAARAYAATPRAGEPWIHSHLELTDDKGTVVPGYGWIFPLGDNDGHVNIGCGALSTSARPARVNTTAAPSGPRVSSTPVITALKHTTELKSPSSLRISWEWGMIQGSFW